MDVKKLIIRINENMNFHKVCPKIEDFILKCSHIDFSNLLIFYVVKMKNIQLSVLFTRKILEFGRMITIL